MFTAVLILTWNGPVNLLAFTASVTSTFAYWSNSPRKIRMVNLVCASPCWLAYDVIVYSLGGIVSESITIISILVSFVRFGWNTIQLVRSKETPCRFHTLQGIVVLFLPNLLNMANPTAEVIISVMGYVSQK